MLKVYNLALIGFGIGMVLKQGQVPTSLDYVGGI